MGRPALRQSGAFTERKDREGAILPTDTRGHHSSGLLVF